jgi:stage II sporulation protein D
MALRFLIVLGVASASLWVMAGNPFAAKGKDRLAAAHSLQQQGRFLDALDLLQGVAQTTENEETSARALFLIGHTYGFLLNQNSIAMDYYRRVAERYPHSQAAPDALFNQAIGLFDLGDYSSARAAFMDFLGRYPDNRRVAAVVVWIEITKNHAPAPALPTPVPEPAPAPAPAPVLPKRSPELRVLIKENSPSIKIYAHAPFEIVDARTNKSLARGLTSVTIRLSGNRLLVGNRKVDGNTCRIESETNLIGIGNRLYRGKLLISAGPAGGQVLNIVPLEDYLYGVVPREMPGSWPQQALMAQAVAARTYALYMKEKNAANPYDVAATTASQVYGGLASETAQTTRAVDATRGQVMVYKGRPIIACFHSNSGGFTEDSGVVWNAQFPYLKAKPDRFSAGASGYNWEYYLSYTRGAEQLRKTGFDIASIKSLAVKGTSLSGRTISIEVTTDKGVKTLSSNQFRLAVGESKVKSTLFVMNPRPAGVLVKGRGYGHGVGMSQWGAKRMAGTGSSYREILNYYYQDIQIVSLGG